MSEEKETKVPSFPAGTFRARADWQSVSHGWSGGDSPTEQLSIRIMALDEWPDVRGKSLLWFGNFSSQIAMDISIKALIVMGWDGKSKIAKPDGTNGALVGVGGVDFEIVVRHETYGGKTRAKIAFVNAIGAGFEFKKPLDDKSLGSLNDRVRRHMAATAPGETRTPSATRPAVPAQSSATDRTGTPQRRADPLTDEARARMIDRGHEPPPMSSGGAAGGRLDPDDDIPF